MSKIKEKASSLTGAIANQLNNWLTDRKESEVTQQLLKGTEHWENERLALANLQSHKILFSVYLKLLLIGDEINQSINGKNTQVRELAKLKADTLLCELLEDHKLKSFAAIFHAKNNGEDIHSLPNKLHKLDIVCGEYYEFGQFVVDQKKVGKND